jgi:hypothetical protein
MQRYYCLCKLHPAWFWFHDGRRLYTLINISSGHNTTIAIKADRGYVDLQIADNADKFQKFSKDNQSIIDERRLYVRTATKSLAIRKNIDTIVFFKASMTSLTKWKMLLKKLRNYRI